MAIIFTNTDRRVVPNWKSFSKTARLGELNSLHPERVSLFSIVEYTDDWKLNKSVPFAADLLSAAVSNDQISSQDVIDAADFILAHKSECTNTQKSLAVAILKAFTEKTGQKLEDLNDENLFDSLLSIDEIYQRIAALKLRINDYPSNPILYVDLSRYYITIGQVVQAVSAIDKALYLGRNNRFIIRSAARLHLHLHDKEHALFILKRNELIKSDPWLMASEISIASMLKKNSNYIKRGLTLLDSGHFSHASLSELASSIGTVEYINGSIKKSKKLFHKSLIDPNDNSLAQAEWAASKSLLQDGDLQNIDMLARNRFYESSALSSFNRKEYVDSIRFASEWIEDMPFAKRPVLFASSISTTHLKDYELSEKILKIGLQANPLDAQLINNVAYACALNDEIKKAEDYLAQIKSNFVIDRTTEICLLATKGLVEFRKGLYDSGRELYLRAIEKTNEFNDSPILKSTAVLNYVREELRIDPGAEKHLTPMIEKIKENMIDDDTRVLKNEVMVLMGKSEIRNKN